MTAIIATMVMANHIPTMAATESMIEMALEMAVAVEAVIENLNGEDNVGLIVCMKIWYDYNSRLRRDDRTRDNNCVIGQEPVTDIIW